jgi:hypothetical protein
VCVGGVGSTKRLDIYIYIYMCVCVCVCVWARRPGGPYAPPQLRGQRAKRSTQAYRATPVPWSDARYLLQYPAPSGPISSTAKSPVGRPLPVRQGASVALMHTYMRTLLKKCILGFFKYYDRRHVLSLK